LLTQESDETEFRNGTENLHSFHFRQYKGGVGCGGCHDPHMGQNQKFILEKVRFGTYLMPQKYTKTKEGVSCLTACHKLKSYNREKAVKNNPDR